MNVERYALALLVACGMTACSSSEVPEAAPPAPLLSIRLETQESGTDVLLQAVSAVDDNVVWASGHGGTWARTLDGGATWAAHVMEGADTLQFRDVHALDADRAWLLSAGPGELSRIYRTLDGGETWELQFLNPEPDGFYDCLEFRDAKHGIVYGDAVDGELRILRTRDGGSTWEYTRSLDIPPALAGEGGFAASGTCVALGQGGRAWIGTGAADTARVLSTLDEGRTWTAVAAPLPAGEAAGIFTIAFRDSLHGVILGGDLSRPDEHTDNVAITSDGGVNWSVAGRPVLAGAVYGAAYVSGAPTPTLVAVGPHGADWSADEGATWSRADTVAYWGLDIASPAAGWLVGPEGRVVRISFE
ncbi:MAG: hypothetical protein WBO43_10540 [Gemmatimonadota bacterium]|jgi:photosystem II stability/assembly factor-like uncharacterized protein